MASTPPNPGSPPTDIPTTATDGGSTTSVEAAAATGPFRAAAYELPALRDGQTPLSLSPLTTDEAPDLARRLAVIPPWSTYGTSAGNLESLFLSPIGSGAFPFAVRSAGVLGPLGVAVIRWPWLVGPYMQFLGLDPRFQGRGIGTRVLAWMEAEARRIGARNLWICAAGFNPGALRLYERFGFDPVADLDDLIQDGVPEVLLRKRLQKQPI
jgi:diamine N-acetyltransferase